MSSSRSLALALLVVISAIAAGSGSIPTMEVTSSAGEGANAIKTFSEMEKKMKKVINDGLKLAMPYVFEAVTEMQLSTGCAQAFTKVVRGIMDIRDWAIKMIDAMGKPSSGILEGTAAALGDYDQCLDIVVPKNGKLIPPYKADQEEFRGQYCMIQINLPKVLIQAAMDYQAGNRSNSPLTNSKTFLRNLVKIAPRADVADLRFGVCIPSTCTKRDLQAIIRETIRIVPIHATALRCETKEDKPFKTEQIIIMAIIATVAAFVFLGTFADSGLRFFASGVVDENFIKKQSVSLQLLLSFSLYTNVRKLTTLEKNDGLLSCVRGLKVFFVIMTIVMSTYVMPNDFHFVKYRSAFHFYRFLEEWWFAPFANPSVGIDTFFFIAGLQIAYRMWKISESKSENKVTVNIPKFLVVWYFRLTLAQLLVIALLLLLPLVGSGPIWKDLVTPEVELCRERWWMNALYINNFWPSNETCLGHTWFVSALMHILIVTPALLWLLNRWHIIGIFVNLVLIIGSCIGIAVVTVVNDLPPAPALYFLSFLNLRGIWDKLFIQAYDHVAPFCIGLLLGYFIAKQSQIGLRKITVILGWSAAIACNASVMCGLYGYRKGQHMDSALAAVYAAAHRAGWSLGIGWIVFACSYGYGGVVNDILSWKMLIPLDRLSYLIYLLHPVILFLHGGQIRERMYMAHIDQAMYATAYIVFTVFLAAVCYVSCHVPFKFLETIVWRERGATSHNVRVSKVIAISERTSNVTKLNIAQIIDENVPQKGNHKVGIENDAFNT